MSKKNSRSLTLSKKTAYNILRRLDYRAFYSSELFFALLTLDRDTSLKWNIEKYRVIICLVTQDRIDDNATYFKRIKKLKESE